MDSIQSSSGNTITTTDGNMDEEYTSSPLPLFSTFLSTPQPPSSPPPPFPSNFSTYLDSTSYNLLSPLIPDITTTTTTNIETSTLHPPPPPQQQQLLRPKSSKKRPRASRRPATTVLTTDTSNFRAMVQEFTGFPAPPFAQPSVRPRLNIGGIGPPSFLRPSPLKYQASGTSNTATASTGASSSLVDALALFAKSNMSMVPGLNTSSSSSNSSNNISSSNVDLMGFNPMLAPPRYASFGFDDDPGHESQFGEADKLGGGHGFLSSLPRDKYDRRS